MNRLVVSRGTRFVNGGLVALAWKRSLSIGVIAWVGAVLAFVMVTSEGTPARADDTLALGSAAIEAGLARESTWLAFVLCVVPLLVMRTIKSVAPWRGATDADADSDRNASRAAASRHGDAPWLATRAVSNASIAVSTWLGAALASCVLIVPFAVVAELRGGDHKTPMAVGSLDGPMERWATSTEPLRWHARVPAATNGGASVDGRRARIQLGLGSGTGIATEVRLSAKRSSPDSAPIETTAVGRIENRGTIEVVLPGGTGGVDFELDCVGADARICVLSERVELWTDDVPAHTATISIALRIVLAMWAWLALALGFSPFVSRPTAAMGVLAAWIPSWWSDAGPATFSARYLPGVDLFDALAVVGDGRAPALPGIATLLGALAVVAGGLCLVWIGLRTWRVSR